MKLVSLRIKNFKGIKDTTINLKGTKGSIYTLVGLNESGKTTLLEAINSFRYDVDGIHAIAQKTISAEPIEALVPKKLKDNFNGDISVGAKVSMESDEIVELADLCKSNYGFQIDVTNFPREFGIVRIHEFKQSAHTKTVTLWDLNPAIKKKKARKFVKLGSKNPEWRTIVREVGKLFPRIVYFPTFLFDFPERILVSDGESEFEGNEYYKRMIEDSLAYLDDPLELKTHIVDRITSKEPGILFAEWYPLWLQSDEKERVISVLAKLSQKISTEIFGRWKEVLGSELGRKEIVIDHIVVEGSESGERRVFLEFKVKDGVSTFKVSERSLGFRWFFCFLLFTRFFRGSESGESIFLFDEPASNLHSRAQSKLLDSLKVIADGKNDVIYSTHSHHLINPLWLETAFIITNGDPIENDSLQTNFVVDDTDIHAQFYKTFVGQNAEKSHYFQPILDRLQVSPSLLEATREGVITEGKSDYYILNWYKKYYAEECTLDFIPVGGATTASSVISLYLGISLRFVLLLDSDSAGNEAKSHYLETLPIAEDAVIQIGDVFSSEMKTIENLISQDLKSVIRQKYSVKQVNKKLILRAFSECLSGTNFLPEDKETLSNLSRLVKFLRKSLESQ